MHTVIIDSGKSCKPVLQKAADAVRGGALAVFPTDTVYGIGCNPALPESVERIYSVKGRASSKPLPILVDSTESAQILALWNDQAERLARKYWPGPMTIVLQPQKGLLIPSCGKDGIGVRHPNHMMLCSWLKLIRLPFAATSANLSGQKACVSAEEVVELFNGSVEYIITGGKLPGLESTVVDLRGDTPVILREGAVPAAEIFELVGRGE